ncbi:MAG: hypothetical protein JXO22_16345 [Phycisphaerae bacterium]|nr:hypothetical protein [Phycisphaerae bacterium]
MLTATRRPFVAFGVLLVLGQASAQWDPSNGDWGKTAPTDVRVMTWNTLSHIEPGADMSEGLYSWCALARIVAAMQPDILLIQEGGDSTSQSALLSTFDKFLHGGTGVGAYVQKYAPGYDLPYIYVSSLSDGYNRNVILSVFPFGDLNGDTVSQRPDISYVTQDEYAPGGSGGIRGFMFVELDLPNGTYAGDMAVGNAHLKAYFGTEEHQQRVTAAKNVAYTIDYLFNGAGTGIPDPHSKIIDNPAATTILDANTPVIVGGDWNEDESKSMSQYGEKGPAGWLTQAQYSGGTDGTDRDRTDMTYDDARNPYNNDRSTQSSSKLDYIAWQDSIATVRRAFIFNSSMSSSWYPPEVASFQIPSLASSLASDHRPVIADMILPLANLPDYTLTVNVSGQGDVLLDPTGGTYPPYSTVDLTADPADGWYFIEWQGDLTGYESYESLLMDSNKTVTAIFSQTPPPTYTLTVDIVGQGSVTVDPPDGPYRDDVTVELAADADPYWFFDHWEGDLTGDTNPEYVPMIADKHVTAVFEPIYYCGDANCDRSVDVFDIDAFVLALTWPYEWIYNYPDCDLIANCDTNRDGTVDVFDVDSFVAVITGAGECGQ